MKALMTVVAILATLPAAAEVYAVKAGTLIDPATGSVTRNQTILVDNGTIRAIGPAVVVPAGAKTVDLSNEYVMPGLMDAHTHLSLTELIGDAPFESFYIKESSTYRAMRAVHNGEVVLHQGFTTVRDLGHGADYAMMDVQRGIAVLMWPKAGDGSLKPPERLDPDEVKRRLREWLKSEGEK